MTTDSAEITVTASSRPEALQKIAIELAKYYGNSAWEILSSHAEAIQTDPPMGGIGDGQETIAWEVTATAVATHAT